MSRYARLNASIQVSDTSDYAKAKNHDIAVDETPDEVRLGDIYEATTTEQTYGLSHLASNTLLAIENLSSTYTVLATVRIQKASKTFSADKLGFTASAPCTITDDDSTFVSSLYFAAGDIAVVSDTSEAGNTGSFFVQAVAAGTLTLAETVSLTLDADDAGTPTIVSRRDITIPIGPAQVAMVNSVVVGSDLKLQAITDSAEVEISYLGT
jgi:hypothetical protein